MCGGMQGFIVPEAQSLDATMGMEAADVGERTA